MKHIKLAVLPTKWGKLVRIIEQTHVGKHFYPAGEGSFVFNGFTLTSCTHPDIAPVGEPDRLYVWGTRPATNHRVLVVPSEEWLKKCRAAVHAYNVISSVPDDAEIASKIEIIE